jgi:branched-chain amino acid transport system permease protein
MRSRLLGGAGIALLLTLPWWIGSNYLLTLVNIIGVNMILALGLLFLFGYCGQLAVGQAGFFAVGAYVSALLTTRVGLNVWLGMITGVAAAALLAAGVGLAILRLRGHYFALATLGLGEIVAQVILNWKEVTGGTDGVTGIPKPAIGGWTLQSDADFYYLLLGLVGGLTLAARRIRVSRIGRSFIAVRSDALAAEVAGLDVFKVKWLAFVLSAVYSGIAGSVYAHMFSFVSPEAFGLIVSINILAMVLIGGAAQMWGVLVGSVIVSGLPELLRFTREYYMLIYGLGLVIVVMFFPLGLSGHLGLRRSAISEAVAPRPGKPREGVDRREHTATSKSTT